MFADDLLKFKLGKLTFDDLWAVQMEHRLFVPRVVSLVLGVIFRGDVRAQCADEMSKVQLPNNVIVGILRKQHAEALQRIARSGDALLALRAEAAELEARLRECRVDAIRSLHSTSDGTRERLAQLHASKAAEVVRNQIQGIEAECTDLRRSIAFGSPK